MESLEGNRSPPRTLVTRSKKMGSKKGSSGEKGDDIEKERHDGGGQIGGQKSWLGSR